MRVKFWVLNKRNSGPRTSLRRLLLVSLNSYSVCILGHLSSKSYNIIVLSVEKFLISLMPFSEFLDTDVDHDI